MLALMCISVVLLSMLSMREGIKRDYLGVGHADRAVITSAGSVREPSSVVPISWLDPILQAPGIRRQLDGAPLVDPEVYGFFGELTLRSGGDGATEVRGMGSKGLRMSPEIKIVDGREYRPGTREVLVGVLAQQKFSGMELGDRIVMVDGGKTLEGGKWTVVGHFSTGSFMDGDLIADPQVMLGALGRSTYNTVLVALQSTQSLAALQNALATNPALSVTVERQSDFWLRQYHNLPNAMLILDYLVSALLASGAISGILHTMHATISARAKEIAILRAVGFGGLPIAIAIVLEAMFFASIGAVLGTAIDWLWLNGYEVTGAYGVFRIAVTPYLLGVAVAWALVIALIGAIAPAAHEARLAVVDALGRA
ncbi:MAG TPA: ABC transporter permease [Steroidobacteraceae bacterium]|nr:ABC transporter permease [Steroidobacteraceae bacterium]